VVLSPAARGQRGIWKFFTKTNLASLREIVTKYVEVLLFFCPQFLSNHRLTQLLYAFGSNEKYKS